MSFGRLSRNTFLIFLAFFSCLQIQAQDLDPRAYVRVPVGTTTAFGGFNLSSGDIVTDPSLAIKNVKANVQALSFGVSRSFDVFGKTSQVLVVLPYSWAQVSGDVAEQFQEVTRSGMGDARLRFTTLLIGGDAGTLEEIVKAQKETILGLGLHVSVPTGEFFSDKLINLGTNRWAFRPEISLSQPLGKRWQADFYSGMWFFTTNKSFYPGTSIREQKPMAAFQAHISYNIRPLLWIAFDGTFYAGGNSTIDDIIQDDRQNNTRIGMTAVVPTGKFSSLKFAASAGALVRVGQDFTTYSVGWQKTWLKGVKK